MDEIIADINLLDINKFDRECDGGPELGRAVWAVGVRQRAKEATGLLVGVVLAPLAVVDTVTAIRQLDARATVAGKLILKHTLTTIISEV